jgi:hypothetical protein
MPPFSSYGEESVGDTDFAGFCFRTALKTF